MSNPTLKALADHCRDCVLVTVPRSSVLRTLSRLPERLFNRQLGEGPEPWTFDWNAILDLSQLGPLPLPGATLQYAITRIFVGLKDAWRDAVAQGAALTLATGEFMLVPADKTVQALTLLALQQPTDGDNFYLQGLLFEFDDDATVTTGAVLVTIGANKRETFENLAVAIGANVPRIYAAKDTRPGMIALYIVGAPDGLSYVPGVGDGTSYSVDQATIETNEGVESQCPHAKGKDLDRLGDDLGIGRPFGFSDCCYWQLVKLLLFTKIGAGSTWHLRELTELYLGVRPSVLEVPGKVTLYFPQLGETAWGYLGIGYWGRNYVHGHNLQTDFGAGYYGSSTAPAYCGADTPGPQSGLTLMQAIGKVKVEGVYVQFVNLPDAGRAGCVGATFRRRKSVADAFWYDGGGS